MEKELERVKQLNRMSPRDYTRRWLIPCVALRITLFSVTTRGQSTLATHNSNKLDTEVAILAGMSLR